MTFWLKWYCSILESGLIYSTENESFHIFKMSRESFALSECFLVHFFVVVHNMFFWILAMLNIIWNRQNISIQSQIDLIHTNYHQLNGTFHSCLKPTHKQLWTCQQKTFCIIILWYPLSFSSIKSWQKCGKLFL